MQRGDAEHAAGFRGSVVQSVEGVRRQDHGRFGLAANPIFLPIHDAKEIGLSCDDVSPPVGRVTVQGNATSRRNGLLTDGKGIAEPPSVIPLRVRFSSRRLRNGSLTLTGPWRHAYAQALFRELETQDVGIGMDHIPSLEFQRILRGRRRER